MLPAHAQNIAERTFEDEGWNRPPSEATEAGEELGLVDLHSPINRLAAAGITTGCDTGRFCPGHTLTRAEAATFFVRILRFTEPLEESD